MVSILSRLGGSQFCVLTRRQWGAVAQSVERATPGEEVPGSIPTVAAGSLLVGSAETEVMVS